MTNRDKDDQASKTSAVSARPQGRIVTEPAGSRRKAVRLSRPVKGSGTIPDRIDLVVHDRMDATSPRASFEEMSAPVFAHRARWGRFFGTPERPSNLTRTLSL